MTAPRVGLALIVAAVLVQVFLTGPWEEEGARLESEHRALLKQHRSVSQRAADLEKRAGLRAEAMALVGRSAAILPSDAAVQKVRGRVVGALEGVGRWRLDVNPGPSPALASVALGTDGDFSDLVALVTDLCRPRSGFVIERLSLSRGGRGVGLEMEAAALGGVS